MVRRMTRSVGSTLLFGLAVLSISMQSALIAQVSNDSGSQSAVRIPFVGCRSDGQQGPVAAPRGSPHLVHAPATLASRLSWYQGSYGSGVPAPRGWYCFSTYGSNGGNLYVSPQPISGPMLLSSAWKGFSGEAVQISDSLGETSGRFEVAKIIARVFPDYASFVHDVIAEGIEPASSFPSTPFPNDKLTYRSKREVEFETPAHRSGLGTASHLLPSADPIRGVAMLVGETPDLVQLTLRLTGQNSDLAEVIVREMEHAEKNGLKD